MPGARIAGLGMHVPDRIVTNDDLSKTLNTSDEWIFQRSGIRERRWVEGDVGPTDLAVPAARTALEKAGIEAEDLDLVLFATLSPDWNFPGSSCLLQAELGIPGVATLDIRNQCTGFVYGLAIADAFLQAGMMQHVLVVGSEVHSTGLDPTDRGRDVTVLFGDGAGAAVVSATEGDSRILGSDLHADGRQAGILHLLAPASGRNPRLTAAMMEEGLHYPSMQGKAVFKHAVEHLPQTILKVLADCGYTLDDMDLLVPHQANRRINEMVGRRLELPEEKVVHNIERYGNTTAASIPMALCVAEAEGRMAEGDLVLLAAFGAGLTWGANLVRW
jgi:3-oxoacyl-[acyl-carrier-protein] synthase-3